MARLTADQLRSRRIHDFQSMMATFPPGTSSPLVPSWSAFASESDRVAGRPTQDGQRAVIYVVEVRLRSLVGRGQFHDRWTIRIDLSDPGYPQSVQWPQVISAKKPWSPHFHAKGVICPGTIWKASLSTAEFVIAILRLLNFDEDVNALAADYGGYNPDATNYWKSHYKAQPLNPNLAYPILRRPGDLQAAQMFGATQTLTSSAGAAGSTFGPLKRG